MSILSLRDIQGIATYSNTIRVPSGHNLETYGKLSANGTLKVPVWSTETRPATPEIGMIGFNSSSNKKLLEVWDGNDWSSIGTAAANYVTSGLALYLDASNSSSYPGSGTSWFDLSGNNRTATLVNGPTYNASNGGNILLDGTDDYIGAPITLGTDATFEVWAKITAYEGNVLFGLGGDSYPSGDFGYGPDIYISGGAWVFNTGDGTGNPFSANPTVNTSSWYQISFTTEASTNAKLYVNGVLIGTAAHRAATVTRTGNRVIVGRWPGSAGYETPGNFAIVRVYNRALTSAEMLQNYNANKSRFGLT